MKKIFTLILLLISAGVFSQNSFFWSHTNQAAPNLTINLAAFTAVTNSQFTAYVTISNPSNENITSRGIVYSTTSNPSYPTNAQASGNGSTDFYVSSGALSPNTTYYVKAYAIIDGSRFVYSSLMSITTSVSPPIQMIATWDIGLINMSYDKQTVTYKGTLDINTNGAIIDATNLPFTLTGISANASVRIIIENDYDQTSSSTFPPWTRVISHASNTSYNITVIFSTNWHIPQVPYSPMNISLRIGNGYNVIGSDVQEQAFPISDQTPNLYFPEAYFPNGDYDRKIDRYIIYYLWWYPSHTVSIAQLMNGNYVRTVYSTTDYCNNPWNGHVNNDLSGELCQQSQGSGYSYRVLVERPGYSDAVSDFNMYYSY